MSLCSSWKRIILICVCGWHKIGWKENNFDPIGKYSIKKSIWENQHFSWIMYTWSALKDNVKWAKILLDNYRTMFESRISAGDQRNYHPLKIIVFLHGQEVCTSRKFCWNTVGKSFWLGLFFVNRARGLFLSVDDLKKTGKKQNISPKWKILVKKRWSGRTNIISWPRILGDALKERVSDKWRYCRQQQEHDRIQNLRWCFRIATKLLLYFRVTGAHTTVLDYAVMFIR